MGNSYKKSNKMTYKSITFWTIIALLTVAFVISMIVMFVKNSAKSVRSLNDREIMISAYNIFDKNSKANKDEEFFIYVYNSADENVLNEEVENQVLTYATFVKRSLKNQNTKIIKLYTFNVDHIANRRYFSPQGTSNLYGATTHDKLTMVQSDVPSLVIIKNGKVAEVLRQPYQIQNKLYETQFGIKD